MDEIVRRRGRMAQPVPGGDGHNGSNCLVKAPRPASGQEITMLIK